MTTEPKPVPPMPVPHIYRRVSGVEHEVRRLYHATTEKKGRHYRETGYIRKPVRGFTTVQAAMAWAMKVGRTVIYRVEGPAHKLPDHHNQFGEAWWIDANVSDFKCVFSANSDA